MQKSPPLFEKCQPTAISEMEFEKIDPHILDPIIEAITPYSEMSSLEKYFLNGITRYAKPQKLLEVGVSAGGSSAILLNAIKDLPASKLYSVDYSEFYYRDTTKRVGFLINDYFPQFIDKWEIMSEGARGGDVSRFINDIGSDIDLVLIDTVHIHPWETLNFLTVLPFLKEGAWVVLHDISLYITSTKDALACKYLFDHVVSENKARPLSGKLPSIYPNIGAFQITSDTYKYIQDVFMSLALPWLSPVKSDDLCQITNIIKENYPEHLLNLFFDAINMQKIYKDRFINRNFIINIMDNDIFKITNPDLIGTLENIYSKLLALRK